MELVEYLKQLYELNLKNQDKEKESNDYKFLEYIRKANQYTKRKFFVKVTDYLPKTIIGMTNCRGTIWIRRLYGYLKNRVLRHEVAHNLDPNASEYEIERRVSAGHPDLSLFEFVYV